ncbi:TDP-N-acetylfucosamine:lipid II N-acetylfucosaminyltransferase [Vogesella indigofera]|uniref:TDP-N-acetylfucosamine:lipid II N-acetylfucosaminyltransferase n=1 Tax=Vogesella indigofera TaxID=45465 RepID=UPI00234EF7CA|nr:TDP-N-acetylfucosamine:lipid II N-acetylfucosaminyltransferase [Vogesella indigofera]MDC7696778.1 TDP-N-acetylfucosamine:lipid II N-acetylfucosaminyltransferase [Vogesella indigofera]
MKKILHIVRDEKFIDMASREFECCAPGRNIFAIIGKKISIKYIKSTDIEFYSLLGLVKLLNSGSVGAVIFHSLGGLSFLTRFIPDHIKVVWIGWGYDYYDLLLRNEYKNGLMLPMTREVEKLIKVKTQKSIKNIAIYVLDRFASINRFDYFLPVLDSEFDLVKKHNSWLGAEFTEWNYGTAEDDFLVQAPGEISGENILVGNSAALENNHLDTFYFIANYVDWEDRKIYVPLSYGNKDYASFIIELGREYFGNQFCPITEFMEKQKYNDLLSTCGYVFMNHIRQQALGNICISMIVGAKIYLNSHSPLLKWFRGKGAFVEEIEANSPKKFLLKPLTKNQKETNREIIFKHWCRENQRKKTIKLISKII